MQILHTNSTFFHTSLVGLLIVCLFCSTQINAQEVENYDSLLAEYTSLDSLLLAEFETDSSSLFDLLEDLMNEDYLKSQFTIRTGYTSNITNAGRNFGVQQYGLNAGVAFYHKSGLFADVGGYYNSDQEPKYNTTIASLGYLGMLGLHWNYFVSFDHFFYHQSSNEDLIVEYPLSNSVNGSINYLIKGFTVGTDYSFMFGDEAAHRIRLNFGYSYSTKKVWIFDAISFNPNLSALAGNANVTSVVFNQEIALENSKELIRQIGRRRYLILYQNNPELLRSMLSELETKNTFGMMNYSLFVPVSFRMKNFTFMVNYSLNLPVALPGEEGLDTSPNNYISATLLFGIPLK
jgi:hypothetical protein